jgi:uncharacterized membrane protein YfcA
VDPNALLSCLGSAGCVVTQTTGGLIIGMLLFLVAVGLTLIFGVLKIVNFTHGAFYMLGAYFALTAYELTGGSYLAAVLAGGIIGLIGGAVGLILGTLRMPALLGRVGMPAARAVGTNLVVGFFLGMAGFAGHGVPSEVDWPVLAVSVAAAVPGAWLGARLTGRMSERVLKRAIGAVLVAVGIAIAVEAAL